MTRPVAHEPGRVELCPGQPSLPIAGSCGCRWDPTPGSTGGSGPYRQAATCSQHQWPHQAPGATRLPAPADDGPGDGEWACLRCGLAYFGTGPEHGLCPDCFGAAGGAA